jgi:hypothetical protein
MQQAQRNIEKVKTTMVALLSTQGHAFFLAPIFSKMKAT